MGGTAPATAPTLPPGNEYGLCMNGALNFSHTNDTISSINPAQYKNISTATTDLYVSYYKDVVIPQKGE
jgi:hypothetical protein